MVSQELALREERVDVSPPNVAAARDAGWNTEIFTDAATMRADLGRHGVRIDRP